MQFDGKIRKLLTQREEDVLSLLASGRTSKEIATALRLSSETIGNYRKQLCRKLNVHSTAELVAYAANARSAFDTLPQ